MDIESNGAGPRPEGADAAAGEAAGQAATSEAAAATKLGG
jgi:hypothetical protein